MLYICFHLNTDSSKNDFICLIPTGGSPSVANVGICTPQVAEE